MQASATHFCILYFKFWILHLLTMSKENEILASWHHNASSWINLIERNGIESRRLATNEAVIETVLETKPRNVIDIGCGEGWLAQQLYERGIAVSGVDAVPALIEKAKEKVSGDFRVATYEEISEDKISFPQSFDAIVINFALIGKESTEGLLKALPNYLSPNGRLIIQTLHPYARKANDYISGWKKGSWDGLGDDFTLPYDWYFRTMEDWMKLLDASGFKNVKLRESKHPESGALLSAIFICQL